MTTQNTELNKPQFYKTIITVTMLTDDGPAEPLSLAQAEYMLREGGWTGEWITTECMPVTPQEMVKLMNLVGSDPDFFQLDGDGYPIETTLVSFDPDEIEGNKIQVEMQVCWLHGEWSNEIYVYVSQVVREEDIERFTIKAMQDFYNSSDTEVSSIHVYHIPSDIFEKEDN